MKRKIKNFTQTYSINNFKNRLMHKDGKTHVSEIKQTVNIADLMLSIMIDSKLSSTEKSILGLMLEDLFWDNEEIIMYDQKFIKNDFVMDITVNDDYVTECSNNINTLNLSLTLNVSNKTIFNNINKLKEKNIIDFKRESFSEFGKFYLNLGYLVSKYYR